MTQLSTASPADPLLTPRQVAECLHVDLSTLRGWARCGHGPARIVLAPQTARYRTSDVERWLSERTAAACHPETDGAA